MRVLLVRHACAGRKEDWDGEDDARPLDAVGRAQAGDLARHLDAVPLRRLLTSPARRCVDTFTEVAARHGLPLETTAVLAADADPERLLEEITGPAFADAALCTHGETLQGVLRLLRGAGTVVRPDGGDEDRLLIKGSVWTLTVEPGATPPVVELRHAVPSAVQTCAAHTGRSAEDRVPHTA